MAIFRCPVCDSNRTFPTPETAYERFCDDCGEVYDDPPPIPDEW